MCTTCGCGDQAGTRMTTMPLSVTAASHAHAHGHGDEHGHNHPHVHVPETPMPPPSTETVVLEQEILAKNDQAAGRNRQWLADRGIVAVNLMSSPGSGKTTLLARTIHELSRYDDTRRIAVVEGDQETVLDAQRIRDAGAPVVQINTGAGCHLDADMLQRGLEGLDPDPQALLFIENVGNLVCPALFDLGEAARVVVISVTEGDDKPLKYPHMFAAADIVVVNKSDLLPYVDFDVASCLANARRINPQVPGLVVSAKTGAGLGDWCRWLLALKT